MELPFLEKEKLSPHGKGFSFFGKVFHESVLGLLSNQLNHEFMEKKGNESKVMNPFVDWGFKYLFGVERAKKNLLGFLNLLLELDSPIVNLQYLNNESIPLDEEGRECIFDIVRR